MNVARSVAEVLTDHVVFEIECIDRMVRHEALCVRVEVGDLHWQAVVAV